MASTGGRYHLLGSEHSLFTGKARAYLMWKGVPFEEVAASRDIYMSFIVPRTGVVFVPVLASPDWSEVVQDTSCIVDYIEARHPARPAIPPSPRRRVVSRLMETFADEWLVMAAMHYRWSFPEQRTYMQMEFGKMVDPTCSAAEQLKLGARTMRPFAGALTMLGVTDATKAAVESTVWEFLDAFNVHLQHHRYFLGATASLVDFALMGPLYAHMYRDPVPGHLMKTRTPFVADWVDRLRGLHEPREQPHTPDDDGVPRRARDSAHGGSGARVGAGAGCGVGAGAGAYCPPPLVPCAFEDGDTVPDTALPMIAMALREHLPIIRDTARALAAYRAQEHGAGAAAGAGADVPRFIGAHEFAIGGAKGERAIQPFVLWMHQRALDDYEALGDAQRRTVDILLEPLLPPPPSSATSGSVPGARSRVHQALQVDAAARVARVDNRLVLGGARSKL